MSDKIINTYNEIMTELYKEATPPADWNEITSKGLDTFNCDNHTMGAQKMVDIVEGIYKKRKIKKTDRGRLNFSIYFGHSPRISGE